MDVPGTFIVLTHFTLSQPPFYRICVTVVTLTISWKYNSCVIPHRPGCDLIVP